MSKLTVCPSVLLHVGKAKRDAVNEHTVLPEVSEVYTISPVVCWIERLEDSTAPCSTVLGRVLAARLGQSLLHSHTNCLHLWNMFTKTGTRRSPLHVLASRLSHTLDSTRARSLSLFLSHSQRPLRSHPRCHRDPPCSLYVLHLVAVIVCSVEPEWERQERLDGTEGMRPLSAKRVTTISDPESEVAGKRKRHLLVLFVWKRLTCAPVFCTRVLRK